MWPYAFLAARATTSKKRVAALAENEGRRRGRAPGRTPTAQRRKNVQALLKDIEKQQAEQKERLTLRRRLEQAGLDIHAAHLLDDVCAAWPLAVCRRLP